MKLIFLLLCFAWEVMNSNIAYACNVDNCQNCSYTGFCGLCKQNYLLTINKETGASFCASIECDVDNCKQCYQADACSVCEEGFFVNQLGLCAEGTNECSVDYCLYCNGTDECGRCNYGYNNQNGYCVPNIPLNGLCQVQFYNQMCQLCREGWIVDVGYGCVQQPTFSCNVDNCISCNEADNCTECMTGYEALSGQCQALSCQIDYCNSCSDSSTCNGCMTNYYLKDNSCMRKLYSCNVENCVVCATMPQLCSQCMEGYEVYSLDDSTGAAVAGKCIKLTYASGTNADKVMYCNTYDHLLMGSDTVLSVGCIDCMNPFINVGGFCVADLEQGNYECDVDHCQFCVQNNYCGKCEDGYYVQIFTGGVCTIYHSPLPNCALTTLYEPICMVCDEGYALVDGACVKYKSGTCEEVGCDFCLEDNQCYQCREGYQGKNGTNTTNTTTACQPICSVDNCFRCSDSSTCGICTYGYVVNDDDGSCIKAEDAESDDCTSLFGDHCTECNAVNCTSCENGYILDETLNTCCQPPSQNHFGCIEYINKCSDTCKTCEKGLLPVQTQCLAVPCSISHCNYCFRSGDVCIACQDGFTFENGECTPLSTSASCPDTCSSCDSDNQCTACVNGYKLYEGKCVCNFQNCLSCMGGAFCQVCAFPTVSTLINSPGCLPSVVAATKCSVDNCQNCIIPNVCGECDAGFTLQADKTCKQNSCSDDSNCLLCDVKGNICLMCNEGYLQSELLGANCVEISDGYSCEVQGCGVCETSDTCDTCLHTYEPTSDKQCDKISCLDNCLICFESDTCFLCSIGFYLNTDNQCAPLSDDASNCSSIDKCIYCFEQSGTLICPVCSFGFTPSSDLQSCQPQDCITPNCAMCVPSAGHLSGKLCAVCEQGYYTNSYFQCVQYQPAADLPTCDVYNCLYCSEDNHCSLCLIGWNSTNGVCQTDIYCDVQNCESCTQPDSCAKCEENYDLTSDGCTPNCGIDHCLECQTVQTCGTCNDTFVISTDSTQCNCPDSTYSITDGQCVCPSGTTEYNHSCVSCNVEYCAQCQESDICSECDEGFVIDEGSNECSCPETFEIEDDKCVCAANHTPHAGACIQCNIQYCFECNMTDNCISCEDSFDLVNSSSCECNSTSTLYDNSCYLCNQSEYCSVCSQPNFCQTCDDTFEVEDGVCECPDATTFYQDTCVQCNIRNCSLCQESNVCETCDDQFTKLDGVCISCSIDSCTSCTSENFCGTCSGSLAVSSNGDSCVTCDVDNCATCSADSQCAICDEGYQLSTDGNLCVTCNGLGCDTCSADNTCQVCFTGFDQNNGACSVCGSPCITCVDGDNSKCETCESPFSSDADSNGNCFTCEVTNCVTCDSSDTTKCITCEGSYTKTSASQCVLTCASTLCTKCEDPSLCEKCVNGYVPNGGNDCKQCDDAPICKHCSQEDTSVCTSCNEGYVLQGGKCVVCSDPSCATCPNGPNTCSTYKGNFVAVKDSDGNVSPAVCNAGCKTCSSSNINICIECVSGFALSSGYCVPCASTCKTCEKSNSSACLSCYGNAFLQNKQCVGCDSSSNCLTCEESNTAACTECPYGFSLQTNDTCKEGCPLNCLSCQNSTFCTVCLSGYAANSNGECVLCLANCRGCSGSAPGLCVNCGTGFFLNTDEDCEVCPAFCKTCVGGDACSVCREGYTLTSSFECVENCEVPCATCSQNDPTKCNSCIAGYSYDSTTSTCTGVTDCPNNICTVCPFGYVLQGSKCLQCDDSCARCSTTNTSVCTSCVDGQYLKNQESCVACPEGCKTCSTSVNCLSCESGYTIQSSPVETTVSCVKCESPCATCIGNAQTCTSCVSGANLQGWKCLTTFNFGMEIQFNVDFSTFYGSYEKVLEDIATAVSSDNIDVNTMFGLRSGSVIMNNNVSTNADSNSVAATNQYNSLNSLLSTNTLGGIPVSSSTLQVNGGDVSSTSSVNLALILGITIPIAVIIIGGIIYFCCSRRNKLAYEDKVYEDSGIGVKQEFELTNDMTGRAI